MPKAKMQPMQPQQIASKPMPKAGGSAKKQKAPVTKKVPKKPMGRGC